MPNGTGYAADILVAIKLDNSALLYDILNLKEIKITEGPTTDLSKNSLRISGTTVTEESVTQESESVKKNSFSDAEEKAKLKNVFGFDIEKGITVNEDFLEEISIYHLSSLSGSEVTLTQPRCFVPLTS